VRRPIRGPGPGGAGHPECPRGCRGPRLNDRPGRGETGAGPQAGTGRGRAGPGHRRHVLAASTHDNAAGIALFDQVADHTGGTVRKALVDQGFKNQVAAHGILLGIDVETVERNLQETGFVPQ
jgi:hypothetical protein